MVLLYFVGINIGGLLGYLCAGYIYKNIGASAIFVCAAVMLVLGTLTFYIGFIKLNLEIYKKEINLKRWLLAIIISIAGTAISVLVIYISSISNIFLVLVIILVCM